MPKDDADTAQERYGLILGCAQRALDYKTLPKGAREWVECIVSECKEGMGVLVGIEEKDIKNA
jgi:hypothetical protein